MNPPKRLHYFTTKDFPQSEKKRLVSFLKSKYSAILEHEDRIFSKDEIGTILYSPQENIVKIWKLKVGFDLTENWGDIREIYDPEPQLTFGVE